MILSNKVYEVMKWFVTVVLPAVGSAYFALGNIWDFPSVENVVGSLAVLATFLGTVLGISTMNYRSGPGAPDGTFDVVEDPGGMRTVHLNLHEDPETILTTKDKITFTVHKTEVE